MVKGNGTSEKTVIFIEVFLSKTQVNIGTTLPIQDMTLCNAITSMERPLTTTDVDNFLFFFISTLTLVYTDNTCWLR